MGCLHAGNLGGDHRHREAGAVNRFHRRGEIGLHAFGQNVTAGANRKINAIESNISCDGSRLGNVGPLQMFGEDTNLQLFRCSV